MTTKHVGHPVKLINAYLFHATTLWEAAQSDAIANSWILRKFELSKLQSAQLLIQLLVDAHQCLLFCFYVSLSSKQNISGNK